LSLFRGATAACGFKPLSSRQTLLTSGADPVSYPASEVAALSHARWEIELGYPEVKTVTLAREETTRSRTPRGVSQELWGPGLAYSLIRFETERMATEAGVSPDRISFKGAVMCIEHTLLTLSLERSGRIPAHLRRLRADPTHFILPKQRQRTYPRAVKIKLSKTPGNEGGFGKRHYALARPPPRIRAGSITTARKSPKRPSKAIPSSRNGIEMSHTIGQRASARRASGQHRTMSNRNRRKLIMVSSLTDPEQRYFVLIPGTYPGR
jgi:hypothetical protein